MTENRLYLCDSFAKLIYGNHESVFIVKTALTDLCLANIYHWPVATITRNVHVIIFA